MIFIQDSDRDWRAYQYPFSFYIFPSGEEFRVVSHYGKKTEFFLEASLEKAKKACYEYALVTSLNQLQAIAPPGARVAYYDAIHQFVCDGQVQYTAYRCCLKPNHSGQCYSREKVIHFDRDNL